MCVIWQRLWVFEIDLIWIDALPMGRLLSLDGSPAGGMPVTILYTGSVWAPDVGLRQWKKHYAERGIDLVALSMDEMRSISGPVRDCGFGVPYLVYRYLKANSFDVVHFNDCCGDGSLALLFEGGWVYGGWASKDQAGTQKNVGYLLHPTENGGPSFTIGGLGTCWYLTAKSKNKDLAWEWIKTWNNKDTVAKINIEDPHPVARSDSADVPEFKAQQYLVDSTKSLEKAKFLSPDASLSKVTTVIQKATGRVASGDASPDDAAKQYSADLKQAIGANLVVDQ